VHKIWSSETEYTLCEKLLLRKAVAVKYDLQKYEASREIKYTVREYTAREYTTCAVYYLAI